MFALKILIFQEPSQYIILFHKGNNANGRNYFLGNPAQWNNRLFWVICPKQPGIWPKTG